MKKIEINNQEEKYLLQVFSNALKFAGMDDGGLTADIVQHFRSKLSQGEEEEKKEEQKKK